MFKRYWWMLLLMPLLGTFAGTVTSAVITYVMPKKYESEAIIEVRPHVMVTSQIGNDFSPIYGTTPITPQFFGTEFEKIKSRTSLAKVVENLQLVNKWNVDQETAIQILKGLVIASNIAGTDLISIKVRHASKEDARDIAAEVAKAYKSYRSEIENRETDKALYELNKAVRDQEDKVEERRKVLATIVRTKGPFDDAKEAIDKSAVDKPGVQPPGEQSQEEAIRRALDAQDYVDAKRDFETDQDVLQKLRLNQISSLMRGKMTEESIVIHEEPQISQSPVSPNVTLNLMLGTAGGFVIGLIMALPVMAIMNGFRTETAE